MIRNIFTEIKISFKKPVNYILFIFSFLLFLGFVHQNINKENQINLIYDEIYLKLNPKIGIQIDILKEKEEDTTEYQKAMDAVAYTYFCWTGNDKDTEACYQQEVKFYEALLSLNDLYGYDNRVYSNEKLKAKIVEFNYLIDHQQTYVNEFHMSSLHSFTQYNKSGLYIVVLIISLIIGSFSIANDFEVGNYKLMMIQPLSRRKYMISKIISVYLTSIIVWLLPILIGMLYLAFTHGVGTLDNPFVYFGKGQYLVTSEIRMCAILFIYHLIISLFGTSLSFMFSYFTKDGVTALILSALTCGIPFVIVNVAKVFSGYAHWSYSVYFDITKVLNGEINTILYNNNISLSKGVLIFIGLSILFILFVVAHFKRKDIEV